MVKFKMVFSVSPDALSALSINFISPMDYLFVRILLAVPRILPPWNTKFMQVNGLIYSKMLTNSFHSF